MSSCSEDKVEGELQRNKSDRRRCPQVLQELTARIFRHQCGHPAAHLEARPMGDTGESLQDEDEKRKDDRRPTGQHVFNQRWHPKM